MKVISFDVGIKNMAYCIFDVSGAGVCKIADWQVLSMMDKEAPAIFCNSVSKTSKKECGHAAFFKKCDKTFCKKHAKSQTEWKIPENRVIKKMKMDVLLEYARDLGIMELPKKKSDILQMVENKIKDTCLEPIVLKKTASASEADLITIGKNMKTIFNGVLACHKDIDFVIIENQISPIANRMKTVQGMLAQYFIMSYDSIRIEFISSANKLKMFAEEKSAGVQTESQIYKAHKKDGVFYCGKVLEKNPGLSSKLWVECERKKKDDLADCFLQGIWWLHKEGLYSA